MHSNNYYNNKLKLLARGLRTKSVSNAEKLIWKRILSKKQLVGYRFLRQRPIDTYIVDFFCPELKLIIEIDGSSHLAKGKNDQIRQKKLEDLGYTVVRFKEAEVLNSLKEVKLQLYHITENLGN